MTDQKLSREEVLRIAKMCRLALSEEETGRLQTEISDIIGYVSRLDELDTEAVTPMSHVQTTTNIVREDRVVKLLTPDEALQNAPEKKGTYLKVPLVIEG
jgi:aspartyl-tRNA(Asn)/glutamyl-tRNA(Gln) amidotransferase subunit C